MWCFFPFLAFKIWNYWTEESAVIATSSSVIKKYVPENYVRFILKLWYCLELGWCSNLYSNTMTVCLYNKNMHHHSGNFYSAHFHYTHLLCTKTLRCGYFILIFQRSSGNSVRLKCPRQLSSSSGTHARVSLILKGLSVTLGPPASIDRTICRPVPAWNSNISSFPACSSPLSYKVLHRLWN